MKAILKCLFWLSCLILLSSCASVYFKPAALPGSPVRYSTLADLPFREIWSGFVFNGEKVGFTVLRIEPHPGGLFRIHSEASLRFKFLGIGQNVWMRSVDVVRPDLTLVSFHHEQRLDGRRLVLDGEVTGGRFRADQSGSISKVLEKELEGPIYPASIINLFPVVQGLNVGTSYQYRVFDPQVQDFAGVSQSVASFEESPRLALEPSFKVITRMHHHEVESWINPKGETIFELAMGGVLITYKEKEEKARRYLSEASLSKKDVALDFSLVRVERPLPCPRKATLLEMMVEGLDGRLPPLRGPGQDFKGDLVEGKPVVLYHLASYPVKTGVGSVTARDEGALAGYLLPSFHIESGHPDIKKAALDAAGVEGTPHERISRLVTWVAETVQDELVENFSALDVLHHRKGECQAHTMLYTALARSLGIPTRVAGGLVYMEGSGFLYHAWAESFTGEWVAVDPTFNQVGVDATHIKLVEGDSWLSLLQVGKVVGRLKAKVLRYESQCP
ncbi:MAG: transglutaminase-like domain-containing protein [Thermodesulfobacteriota bacterium]